MSEHRRCRALARADGRPRDAERPVLPAPSGAAAQRRWRRASRGDREQRSSMILRVRGTPVQTRGPRLPGAPRTKPGLHPGHPTAVGGLPASKPGLSAGTHDLRERTVAKLSGAGNPSLAYALRAWSAPSARFGPPSADVVCFRSSQRTAVGAGQLLVLAVGSINWPPSSSGLGLRPFTAAARVRIPLGVRGS